MSHRVPKESFTFLKDLKQNNDRAWFQEHKPRYQSTRQALILVVDDVLDQLREYDHIETPTGKAAMYRIYRDVRFSKDKTPYNVHWSALFKRATASRRGSYYLRIEPGGKSIVGGGFWGPNPDDMRLIRSHLAQEPEALRKIISSPTFTKTFGELQGRQVKTAPRGYKRDHPAIDLLRYKQFFAARTFSDREVLSVSFVGEVIQTYQAIRPFFDYMSEILTTDLNGESLLP